MTDSTHTWTSSGWPTWWEPETTYAFSDGRELKDGEDFPPDAISEKDWKRDYGQQWDSKKSREWRKAFRPVLDAAGYAPFM